MEVCWTALPSSLRVGRVVIKRNHNHEEIRILLSAGALALSRRADECRMSAKRKSLRVTSTPLDAIDLRPLTVATSTVTKRHRRTEA